VLNATTFLPGIWHNYAIPALVLNMSNHVQLVPTWLAGATAPAYFFSYRRALGWDTTIMTQYTNS
jgi:hypothetical protein